MATFALRKYLDDGGEADATDEQGNTLLHNAAKSGHNDVIELLFNYGANLDLRQKFDSHLCALHLAAEKGHVDTAQCLLTYGANPNTVNEFGVSPLHLACRRGQAALVEVLLASGAQIDGEDKNKQTPLHWAALSGCSQVVEMLLDAHAPVDARDILGRSPLHLAAANKRGEEAVGVLLRCGAMLDAGDDMWRTPLHFSCISENVLAIQALVDHDADLTKADKEGHLAIAYADDEGRRIIRPKLTLKLVNEERLHHPSLNLQPSFTSSTDNSGCVCM